LQAASVLICRKQIIVGFLYRQMSFSWTYRKQSRDSCQIRKIQ
jgi:hypothetical protein